MMQDMRENMEIDGEKITGAIKIRTKDFIMVHDYFAEILNMAQELSELSETIGDERLSREECAGRLMMVTMMQMETLAHENPDLMEELKIAATMADKAQSKSIDTMYG